ncbi:non-structural maintenance of chromosome element 3 [Fusarium subglutinans]|uniref:Non-structural maintenance of chromosome element 3 n=1 Tax=Gibberella subglutinans TaxID=42677 RepID=A0A8H5QCQ3_GIBSU|nr:non-structural maintenance of chromosome element 3 [Fusarium subglutinans]KAF5612882.1 non-structural maintenance of chromosome element 3 [Fusarium subglutinans]
MPTQRRRRPALDEESEEDVRPRQRNRADLEHENEQEASDAEMDEDQHHTQSADDQLVKKLVRYVISCEYSRTAIRRDGIKERVLGTQGRSFRRIFDLAQTQLRRVWGMELRELPVREKMSLQEKRQAMKANAQPKVGSGAYILTSILPEAYRHAAILTPSKTPSADDEATYAGFYTMIISVIYLSGGELSDQKLKRYLQRLNADRNVSMDKTEIVLKRMEKQGYVVKRVERPPLGQDGDPTTTWHVGPRGKEEVGVDGVMGMTREVYGDSWNDDNEKKLRASLNIRDAPQQDGEEEDEAEGEGSRMQG